MRVRHGTLVISTATSIAVTSNRRDVSIRHLGADGTAPIYARCDGTVAVVAANDTYSIQAGETRTISRPASTAPSTVSMISAGAIPYEVVLP